MFEQICWWVGGSSVRVATDQRPPVQVTRCRSPTHCPRECALLAAAGWGKTAHTWQPMHQPCLGSHSGFEFLWTRSSHLKCRRKGYRTDCEDHLYLSITQLVKQHDCNLLQGQWEPWYADDSKIHPKSKIQSTPRNVAWRRTFSYIL